MKLFELGGHNNHKNQATTYKYIRDLHDEEEGQRTQAEPLQIMHQDAVLTQRSHIKQCIKCIYTKVLTKFRSYRALSATGIPNLTIYG